MSNNQQNGSQGGTHQGGQQNPNKESQPQGGQDQPQDKSQEQKQDTTLFDKQKSGGATQSQQKSPDANTASRAYDEYAKEMTKNGTPPQKQEESGDVVDVKEQKNMTWQIIISVIIIIILVLIFALPGRDKGDDDAVIENSNNNTDSSTRVEESEDNNVIATEFIRPRAMEPVNDGDFVYKFEGITWEMTAVDAGTAVAFRFDDFSRRDDNPVIFSRPFRLGTFSGTCIPVSQLSLGSAISGVPLSFAQCVNESGTTDLILTQNGAEITAHKRTTEGGEILNAFEPFFTRMLTELVS